MRQKDVYDELCWMLAYPQSERLYRLWRLLLPDEMEAKVLAAFKGAKAPHTDQKTAEDLAGQVGITPEEAERYLFSLLTKGVVAKVGDGLWAFGPYGRGCVEDVTDGISYSICMHDYDPESKTLKDPAKQAIIDANNEFLDQDWYHLQRPDELIHARWLMVAGSKPRVVPQLVAVEKSGIRPEDYPDPASWNIRYRCENAVSINVTACPCRFRNGRADDFPLMTCAALDLGDNAMLTHRVNGEVEAGNRIRQTAETYLDTQRRGERMGMLHTCPVCLCEDSCCNILNPLKQLASIKEGLQKSAFRARAKNNAACVGCATCVKQCRFEAIKIETGRSVIDADKCYGCGVCVTMCPNNVNELFYAGLEYEQSANKKEEISSET